MNKRGDQGREAVSNSMSCFYNTKHINKLEEEIAADLYDPADFLLSEMLLLVFNQWPMDSCIVMRVGCPFSERDPNPNASTITYFVQLFLCLSAHLRY